jgi:hypothetical protein
MAFSFTYQSVQRKPNPMVKINPLKHGTGKVVTLQDRIDTLNTSAAWKKSMKAWSEGGKLVDLSRLPKVAMVELGKITINEDIQRVLDDKHCANKIANIEVFDPALLQTLQCILTSDGEYISIDGQHTAATIAALISWGMVPKNANWKTFQFPVQYIETNNLAFARRAFSTLNGRGKKKQSQYQQLRNSVLIIRIDGDTSDAEDVKAEKKVSIAEKYEIFPVERDSTLAKYPGTFTNISTFDTLDAKEIKASCEWHNKYFHYEPVHVSLFFVFRDLCRGFGSAKIPLTTKLTDEIAAMVQSIFINLSQFQESVTEAYRRWSKKRYGYPIAWDDDAYACALVQLYQYFGGTEKIPLTLLDKCDDLIKFFDQDILDMKKV